LASQSLWRRQNSRFRNSKRCFQKNFSFINTIWGWIAKLADHPDDAKLTLAAFISLIGAFPCTLLFKLIAGVEREPFPDARR